MEKQNIFIAIGQALFAVFGSCVKWLNLKDKEPQRLFSLISGVMSAAFSGFLVYFIYEWLHLNVYIAFALAAIVGHQGANGVDMLGKYIIKNSGLQNLDENEKKDTINDDL